jgi:hypothetical protein
MARILLSGRPNSKNPCPADSLTGVVPDQDRNTYKGRHRSRSEADDWSVWPLDTRPKGLGRCVPKCSRLAWRAPAGQSGKFFVWSAGQTISMGHSPQLESPGSVFRSHPLRDIVSPERTCP